MTLSSSTSFHHTCKRQKRQPDRQRPDIHSQHRIWFGVFRCVAVPPAIKRRQTDRSALSFTNRPGYQSPTGPSHDGPLTPSCSWCLNLRPRVTRGQATKRNQPQKKWSRSVNSRRESRENTARVALKTAWNNLFNLRQAASIALFSRQERIWRKTTTKPCVYYRQ